LIRVDSVNLDLVPGATGEEKIAAFIKDWLTGRGVA
jgi:hypothetical protein